MSRRVFRSTSLVPSKPATSPVRPRICNSAPSQVIPDPEEDWDWGPPPPLGDTISLRTSDDQSTRDGEREDFMNEVNIPVEREEFRTGNAGDFTDFMDDSSSTASSTANLHLSDSDEPYEYWTRARSFSRSPFSNCSSLSYEDSEHDEDPAADCSGADNSIEAASDAHKTPSPIDQLQRPSPKAYRFSDLDVKRSWTGLLASFNGPTSV